MALLLLLFRFSARSFNHPILLLRIPRSFLLRVLHQLLLYLVQFFMKSVQVGVEVFALIKESLLLTYGLIICDLTILYFQIFFHFEYSSKCTYFYSIVLQFFLFNLYHFVRIEISFISFRIQICIRSYLHEFQYILMSTKGIPTFFCNYFGCYVYYF